MITKVCGINSLDQMDQLRHLSVDMMGFVFHPPSARYAGNHMALAQAVRNNKKLPLKIGVFVNAHPVFIEKMIHEFQLDGVQFHGQESPELVASFRQKCITIKAFAVDDLFDFNACNAYQADYFLMDTKSTLPGGNGKKFNWEVLKNYKGEIPFLLSGGIGPTDSAAILQFAHPKWTGIDLNSRFEYYPGYKNYTLINQFLKQITCPTI